MAKSKKSKTLKKGTKGKRKMHNTKKHVRHGKNYINIDNTGLTKVIYTEGNKSPKKPFLNGTENMMVKMQIFT